MGNKRIIRQDESSRLDLLPTKDPNNIKDLKYLSPYWGQLTKRANQPYMSPMLRKCNHNLDEMNYYLLFIINLLLLSFIFARTAQTQPRHQNIIENNTLFRSCIIFQHNTDQHNSHYYWVTENSHFYPIAIKPFTVLQRFPHTTFLKLQDIYFYF